MCGIVGYIGKKQAAPILLDGLSKLEYRGYDWPESPSATVRLLRLWSKLRDVSLFCLTRQTVDNL